jgi:phosphatidate cytidylyltransferase
MSGKAGMPQGGGKTSRISDWVTRPFFGFALAGGALAIIFAGTPWVAGLAALAAALGAREWYRMTGGDRYALSLFFATAATVFAVADYTLYGRAFPALVALGGGALAVLLLEAATRGNPLWGAFGVLYLGLPALSVTALRAVGTHGVWLVLGLFLAVWATDTGAFVTGNVVRGPKLWPRLSPNKTWSGLFGGILAAALVEAVFALIIGCAFLPSALFGAVLALASHAGDLFESFVKRHFRIKDSGSLIPGHGGILDRIDSTLFASVALALLVFVFHFDPLFGVRP